MLFSKNRSLEDSVTERLLKAPCEIKKLHQELKQGESRLSLRAVYKTIENLIAAGVILKVGKVVRIDEEWARGVRDCLSPRVSIILDPGERLSYSFTSMAHLDTFWKTVMFQLEEYEKDGQIFFYNPHNFWAYLSERKESENAYYRHFSELKRHAFFTLGGENVGDREFKKAYQNDYLQIACRAISSLSRTHHVTVLGDHIISVRIGKVIAKRIDELYATDRPIEDLLPELLPLFTSSFPSRFSLECNPLKAKKLKKILSRDFYFPSIGQDQD